MEAESVWLGVSRREKARTLLGLVVTSLTEGDGRGTGLGDYVEVEVTGDWLEGGNALRAPGNSGLELRIEVRAEGVHLEVNSQEGQLMGPDVLQLQYVQSRYSSSSQNLSPPMGPDLSSISPDSPFPPSVHALPADFFSQF